MPLDKQRSSSDSSDSSDVSFIQLGKSENSSSSGQRRGGRARLLFVGAIILVLLCVTFVLCVLLGLLVLGKICVRHGDGGSWPTSVGPCSEIDSSNFRGRPLYISLAINFSRVPACTEPLRPDMQLPCEMKRQFLTGSPSSNSSKKFGYKLGPLVCRDDAYSQNGGQNNCDRNGFQLAFNDTGVTIPEDGVYRVHSSMSFVDSLDYYVSGIVRVDPADCVTNPECSASEYRRDDQAHTWLSCANQHNPKKGNRFSACNIDGVRRFNRGDVISFSVTQAFRSINPYYKTTHFFIHKL